MADRPSSDRAKTARYGRSANFDGYRPRVHIWEQGMQRGQPRSRPADPPPNGATR
jgi:hypothetical protein